MTNMVKCPNCGHVFASPIQGSGTISVPKGGSITYPCPNCKSSVDVSRNQI